MKLPSVLSSLLHSLLRVCLSDVSTQATRLTTILNMAPSTAPSAFDDSGCGVTTPCEHYTLPTMAANVENGCAQVDAEWASKELIPFLDLVFGQEKGYRDRAPAAWLKDVRRIEKNPDEVVSTAPSAIVLCSPALADCAPRRCTRTSRALSSASASCSSTPPS
jgi:hypothetical protein